MTEFLTLAGSRAASLLDVRVKEQKGNIFPLQLPAKFLIPVQLIGEFVAVFDVNTQICPKIHVSTKQEFSWHAFSSALQSRFA
tara:strand:- start:525 stop:773 length:249 start_codon:yes stop_codon:yes gene_type:complete